MMAKVRSETIVMLDALYSTRIAVKDDWREWVCCALCTQVELQKNDPFIAFICFIRRRSIVRWVRPSPTGWLTGWRV